MVAVIMAGGRGTRIAAINSEVPKPMIEILGKPVLLYQIENLKKQNILDIILVVGYLKDQIIDYFQDGSKFGVKIRYVIEEQPLGTAGSFYHLKDMVHDDILLLNGDIIFDIDFNKFISFHKSKHCLATILTHPNSHPFDSSLIVTNDEGMITKWYAKDEERLWYKNRVNSGIHIISYDLLKTFVDLENRNLDRDVLRPLVEKQQIYAYDSPEYVKDMGTPDRYEQVKRDLQAGYVEAKSLANKQKAIFIDRDGTINKYVGFLTDIDKFELIGNAAQAIKIINQSGYLAICVTNQPVVARGEVTFDELNRIHNKMETLLSNDGAYLDAIYYCPHHTDKGFAGEIPELKINCECRKPKPGMILSAAQKYNIDLSKSWMIGDDVNDVLCGKNANCKTILISNDDQLIKRTEPNLSAKDLYEAVRKIMQLK